MGMSESVAKRCGKERKEGRSGGVAERAVTDFEGGEFVGRSAVDDIWSSGRWREWRRGQRETDCLLRSGISAVAENEAAGENGWRVGVMLVPD